MAGHANLWAPGRGDKGRVPASSPSPGCPDVPGDREVRTPVSALELTVKILPRDRNLAALSGKLVGGTLETFGFAILRPSLSSARLSPTPRSPEMGDVFPPGSAGAGSDLAKVESGGRFSPGPKERTPRSRAHPFFRQGEDPLATAPSDTCSHLSRSRGLTPGPVFGSLSPVPDPPSRLRVSPGDGIGGGRGVAKEGSGARGSPSSNTRMDDVLGRWGANVGGLLRGTFFRKSPGWSFVVKFPEKSWREPNEGRFGGREFWVMKAPH